MFNVSLFEKSKRSGVITTKRMKADNIAWLAVA